MSVSLKAVGPHRILYVMAVDAEYGPHLKARIAPFMTGVGPVEAAVQLTLALCHLEAEGNLPDLVVSLGSAGSATLQQTGVYQATSVSYRDMDASLLTIEFKVNLMSPGRGERFLFRGEVTKPGSTIIVADGRAYALGDGPAKLIASMTATMMVIRGREDIAG